MKSDKNILIINSSPDNFQPIFNLLLELDIIDFSFSLFWSGKKEWFNKKFKEKKWLEKKIYLGPPIGNSFYFLFFIITLPLNYLLSFIYILPYKYFKKIDTIICLGINEKIIFTPLAKILKIKVLWLENSDFYLPNFYPPKKLLFLYKIYSRLVHIISFTKLTEEKLINIGIKKANIRLIPLGTKLNQYNHQENIFSKIARTEILKFNHKFFTIGTITELNKDQNIEILFRAIKTCLAIIPNMQIIIVGEGEERKNLAWLAKKMVIDNIVWFVGKQSYLKKWLDSFDIFVSTNKFFNLDDLETILKVMASKIPIIGPSKAGLEYVINNSANNLSEFLIAFNNSDELAGKIIKLFKDKNLRQKLGQINNINVEKNFNMAKQAEEFKKIL
ncbi:hypothetical protein CO115_05290 [Candidatus Falkowbacteria bacterium CG_4_9_14_3_um_filter_36_9]|uniref:Glycosyl transferase family 1 domain-containing protein n=1 Tax=Candidatus Falkowbacteria bacterium CG02_land_8_20_14_3_00_36_14 TaxID=1974560 RepID=A0A2M7DN95_9BACT|nr:MAG: hypothetical protein COS18_03115 [Candidatus Falkowbacteria bacterium CG02_land_8_20_14_3_00_36_14]PJA10026.1 MAG: hypothetical protein COX67_05610 [Candidatus Falkowbacteria bacterium CG_4_10_14_0_2_um_filter_36_22]PJB17883.1 MAG: hypothetical protein CO115_05290 [Candidatus Falkowbacteria bacterium CG_4_9_14_3_um_filter_36_9]